MKNKFYLEILTITLIYIVGSLLTPENYLAVFSIVWQLGIILYLYLVKRIRPNINLRQTIIFLMGFSLISWFVLGNHSIISIVRTIILAPIMEELFFREYLFNVIVGKSGRKIILSSMFFGAYHLKNVLLFSPSFILRQILSGVVLGLLNGYLRHRFNSITMPIVIHSFNNGIFVNFQKTVFKLFLSFN